MSQIQGLFTVILCLKMGMSPIIFTHKIRISTVFPAGLHIDDDIIYGAKLTHIQPKTF